MTESKLEADFQKDLKKLVEEITKLKLEDGESIIDDPLNSSTEPSTAHLIHEGLYECFGGEEGVVGAEVEWFLDPKHTDRDLALRTRFSGKLGKYIQTMDVQQIDDVDFFIQQVILLSPEEVEEIWWWDEAAGMLLDLMSDRLQELDKIEDEELEDDRLMKEALKRSKSNV